MTAMIHRQLAVHRAVQTHAGVWLHADGKGNGLGVLVTCNLVLVVPVGSPTNSTVASPGNSVRVVRSTFNSVGYPAWS